MDRILQGACPQCRGTIERITPPQPGKRENEATAEYRCNSCGAVRTVTDVTYVEARDFPTVARLRAKLGRLRRNR